MSDKASITNEASLKDASFKDVGADRHLAVEVPAAIAALSEPDRVALDKATTRKVDLLLMPALVVLYILNYLGKPPYEETLTYARPPEHLDRQDRGHDRRPGHDRPAI